MKKYLLEISVFICGAVVMIMELTGSRVLAPYVGTSVQVWTALIGIILASLSAGYWLGGIWADKYPTYRAYAMIIFFGGVAMGYAALAHGVLLPLTQVTLPHLAVRAVVNTIVLFAPASVLLGMVSPYAVKLRMHELSSSGATVGRLYAISTVGSIVGTFSAGFFLMSLFGSRSLLYLAAVTLIALSLVIAGRDYLRTKLGIAFFLLLAMALTRVSDVIAASRGHMEIDTSYSHVVVSEGTDPYSDRRIRMLKIGAEGIQSGMYVDDPFTLVFPYTRYYRLAAHFRPDLNRALMIGGGAYSYPKDFLRSFPEAELDVVEIDPALTDVAKTHFHLSEDPRLRIIHEDGRTFINRENGQYQTIFIDAFNSLTPPFHLMTKEATEHLYRLLDDDGVVIVNVVAAVEGDKGKMFRAAYHTYASVFPHVSVLPVHHKEGGELVQNIILIAQKNPSAVSFQSDVPEFNVYLSHLFTKDIPKDVPVLTDDFAPVEDYVSRLR